MTAPSFCNCRWIGFSARTSARAAGYGWLVIDMTTDVLALNGVDATIYLPMRYGGHVSAALWIASASWQAQGVTRVVGLLLALNLGAYSLIPNGPVVLVVPAGFLIPIWLVLAGHHLAQAARYPRPASEPTRARESLRNPASRHATSR